MWCCVTREEAEKRASEIYNRIFRACAKCQPSVDLIVENNKLITQALLDCAMAAKEETLKTVMKENIEIRKVSPIVEEFFSKVLEKQILDGEVYIAKGAPSWPTEEEIKEAGDKYYRVGDCAGPEPFTAGARWAIERLTK